MTLTTHGSLASVPECLGILKKDASQYITWSSLMAQRVKGPALSLQWLGPLLCHRFLLWPWNFHMPQMQPPPKKNKCITQKSYIWYWKSPFIKVLGIHCASSTLFISSLLCQLNQGKKEKKHICFYLHVSFSTWNIPSFSSTHWHFKNEVKFLLL